MIAALLSLAIAQCPPGAAYCPAPVRRTATQSSPWQSQTVRIVADLGDSTGYGSGAIVRVGETSLVITARHVVRGARRITARHTTGTYEARVIAEASDCDLAALEIATPPGAKNVQIAKVRPDSGVMLGYGTDGRWHAHSGSWVRDGRPSGNTADDHFFGFRAHDGDSGGAVVTPDGQLAGVVWGSNSDGSMVVSTAKLRSFLVTPTCFRWFQRRQPQSAPGVVVTAPGVGVSVGATTPVAVVPVTPVAPVPVAPLDPSTIPAPIATVPAAIPAVAPFDPSNILARLAALETAVPQIGTALGQLQSTVASHGSTLAKGINFQKIGANGVASPVINKQLGDLVTIASELVPNSTTPSPPTPVTPAK